MERVAYLLGAGFSAPLGLPVMSNFLEKSKDAYFGDRTRYGYFSQVLKQVRDFSVAKNFYQSDLFNIEEILSILEMANQLENRRLKRTFIRYIADVVTHYTPGLQLYASKYPSNWARFVFGVGPNQREYGYFFAGLLNLCIQAWVPGGPEGRRFKLTDGGTPKAQFAVITMNYDRLLENYSEHAASHLCLPREAVSFRTELPEDSEAFSKTPVLAKLHGCVSTGTIIPPTWSKRVDRRIIAAWRAAYRVLVEATHLRIIGYSLPDTDAYVRYLLKSAAMKSEHLKRIDVLCLDPSGAVRRRYEDFIVFPGFRFLNTSATTLLRGHADLYGDGQDIHSRPLNVNSLFDHHEEFFTKI